MAVDPALARIDLAVDTSELADRIDGAIGELSPFHQLHGYDAQGVEVSTAVLVDGWRERLVPVICETRAEPVVGWCLAAPDLWVAKAVAGREKDRAFCEALARAGIVAEEQVVALVGLVSGIDRARVERAVRTAFG